SDSLITNNIFSGNGTAIATATNLTRLTYNAYHNNGTTGAITLDANSLPNSSVTNPDPLFVNPGSNDFHLQSGSPCHLYDGANAGNPVYPNPDNPAFFDMGAYGGPDSDTIPIMISGLTASSGAAANAITLNWNLNMSYQVSGYHVYYGTASGDRSGTGASEGNSPVTIPQGVNSATLSNIPLTPTTTPAAVTGVTLSPADRALFVSWTPSANATRYKVYYSTAAFTAAAPPATFLLVNGANSAGIYLEGLTNGVTYFVAVAALDQSRYFLTVTAFNAGGGTPGVSNESPFAEEKVGYLGPYQESVLSNVVSAAPALQPITVGNLGSIGSGPPGCFIATAAYGYYSAPQVQLLRDFRDRCLVTNAPGRAFVAWYYRYGPCGADFINAHPWCKPLVRLLLLPLIGGAVFSLHTSLPAKCVF
ncbi:MAG: Fibronectin, type domain protein, partial [Deltaproteobacteria bacterium]|nr:Fibronectin, type domain protein [Deltaproteobacteria bacterium]